MAERLWRVTQDSPYPQKMWNSHGETRGGSNPPLVILPFGQHVVTN